MSLSERKEEEKDVIFLFFKISKKNIEFHILKITKILKMHHEVHLDHSILHAQKMAAHRTFPTLGPYGG